MFLVGMNICVNPAPGFEKEMVLPIPTPERVPIPKDSFGLKYICLLRLNLTLFSGIDLNVNFLETSLKTVVAVCADATVESTALRTLTLEFSLSTLRILILSDPIPRISFSLKPKSSFLKEPPDILKKVTIPVAPSVPTPVVSENFSVETPILKVL